MLGRRWRSSCWTLLLRKKHLKLIRPQTTTYKKELDPVWLVKQKKSSKRWNLPFVRGCSSSFFVFYSNLVSLSSSAVGWFAFHCVFVVSFCDYFTIYSNNWFLMFLFYGEAPNETILFSRKNTRFLQPSPPLRSEFSRSIWFSVTPDEIVIRA